MDKKGELLADSMLPATLTADWLEDEDTKGEPFPTYTKLLSKRGTSEGESRYSWTIDFAARRAEAREKMQPHLDKAAALKEEVIPLKVQLKIYRKEKRV